MHFKGCNVGKQKPFLDKFKEALGGHVIVTAPKHFHEVFFDDRFGVWESMAYEFMIRRPEPFKDRNAALQAFQGANFTLINGQKVPLDTWETKNASKEMWFPSNIVGQSRRAVPAKLATAVGKRTTTTTFYDFYAHQPAPFDVTINSTATTFDNRKDDLRTELGKKARFKTSHEFPMYVEFGYKSVAGFVNGYTWTFTKISASQIQCLGTRIEYMIAVPILDPADPISGTLFANFYPKTGTTNPAILNVLVESDTKFFETA
jgi:hypothetical protein